MPSKVTALIQAIVGALSILFFGLVDASGAAAAAFIVTESATVDGKLDGSLQLLSDNAAVQIGGNASIAGDLMIVPEKARRGEGGGQSNQRDERNPSSNVKIDNQGGTGSLKGRVSAVEAFATPPVLYAARRPGSRNIVVEDENAAIDCKDLGNLTLNHRRALIVLPPGSYGDFSLKQGTLLLGFGGGQQALRYEFQRLNLDGPGRILVAGPVVVTLAGGGTWLGQIGDEANLFWLDMRVATGDINIGAGATFNGCLSAPMSLVTIGSSATFKGELVARRLTIEDKATARAVGPLWTATKGQGNGPTFSQRALRLQSQLPKLQRQLQGRSSASVAYPEDFPFVMISGRPTLDKDQAVSHERDFLFEAFCALFDDTGFERAGVVLTATGNESAVAQASVRNVVLTASQFEQLLQELGGKSSAAENIQTIRASLDLLGRFMDRALEIRRMAAGHP